MTPVVQILCYISVVIIRTHVHSSTTRPDTATGDSTLLYCTFRQTCFPAYHHSTPYATPPYFTLSSKPQHATTHITPPHHRSHHIMKIYTALFHVIIHAISCNSKPHHSTSSFTPYHATPHDTVPPHHHTISCKTPLHRSTSSFTPHYSTSHDTVPHHHPDHTM
jgi:hypothetical protein